MTSLSASPNPVFIRTNTPRELILAGVSGLRSPHSGAGRSLFRGADGRSVAAHGSCTKRMRHMGSQSRPLRPSIYLDGGSAIITSLQSGVDGNATHSLRLTGQYGFNGREIRRRSLCTQRTAAVSQGVARLDRAVHGSRYRVLSLQSPITFTRTPARNESRVYGLTKTNHVTPTKKAPARAFLKAVFLKTLNPCIQTYAWSLSGWDKTQSVLAKRLAA